MVWQHCANRTLPPSPDQVGLPDFNAGAMENWGLVTYRENSLLYDSAYSSISNKERVVTVIAHELAHQVAAMPLAHPASQLDLADRVLCPPLAVVREPGDAAVVERSVAQRGFRLLRRVRGCRLG